MKKTGLSKAFLIIWTLLAGLLMQRGCLIGGIPSIHSARLQSTIPFTRTPFSPPPTSSSSPQPTVTFTITPFRTPFFRTRSAYSLSPQPTATFPVSLTLIPVISGSKDVFYWRDLAFDEFGGYYADYSKSIPRMVVVSNLSEVEKVKEAVGEYYTALLKQVDYATWVPLIIFSGWHGSTGYSIQVQSVEIIDKVVKVSAEFLSPAPNQVVGAAETHPYRIIEIQRSALSGEITFELVVGQQIISQSKQAFQHP